MRITGVNCEGSLSRDTSCGNNMTRDSIFNEYSGVLVGCDAEYDALKELIDRIFDYHEEEIGKLETAWADCVDRYESLALKDLKDNK